jgi:hypothetical protein
VTYELIGSVLGLGFYGLSYLITRPWHLARSQGFAYIYIWTSPSLISSSSLTKKRMDYLGLLSETALAEID